MLGLRVGSSPALGTNFKNKTMNIRNAYTISIALNPENKKKYKSVVLTGIVFATDQAKAVALAMSKVQETIDKNPEIKMVPKLSSARNMNAEFVIFENNDKAEKDGDDHTTS